MTALQKTSMNTAIFSHPECSRHDMGEWHPESPARLQAIEDQLILARIDGLLERRDAPLAELPAMTASVAARAAPAARKAAW